MNFSIYKSNSTLLFSLVVLITLGCHKVHISCVLTVEKDCYIEFVPNTCLEDEPLEFTEFDIFLIVGQSNTCSGKGLDPSLDKAHPRIKQLGRHDGKNFQIIPAVDPLDHHYRVPESIGFAMTFAREYVCDQLGKERNVLLIPAALNDTGFKDMRWRPGDDLYNDAVFRTNEILKRYQGSRIKGFLWHQGEKDVGNPLYTTQLDSMIRQLRRDIDQDNANEIPFILGGMVPNWVDARLERRDQECLIRDTPQRVDRTAFVDPRYPCTIRKKRFKEDKIHYDAEGQRELGRRYYKAYRQLM